MWAHEGGGVSLKRLGNLVCLWQCQQFWSTLHMILGSKDSETVLIYCFTRQNICFKDTLQYFTMHNETSLHSPSFLYPHSAWCSLTFLFGPRKVQPAPAYWQATSVPSHRYLGTGGHHMVTQDMVSSLPEVILEDAPLCRLCAAVRVGAHHGQLVQESEKREQLIIFIIVIITEAPVPVSNYQLVLEWGFDGNFACTWVQRGKRMICGLN